MLKMQEYEDAYVHLSIDGGTWTVGSLDDH